MRLLFSACFIFISSLLLSQINDSGLPFIQSYGSEDYIHGHSQNWCAVQGDNGKMYFGNTEGILEFDGHNWRLIKLPNEAGALSIEKDKNGVIYVGAFSDFGYLAKDSLQLMQFVSLKDKAPEKHREFEVVWETLISATGTIFFRTTGAIFNYFPLEGKIEVIEPESSFLRIIACNNKLYCRQKDIGLISFQDNKYKLVKNGEYFKDMSIYGIEPYNESSMLVFGKHSVFRYYFYGKSTEKGKIFFEPFQTDFDEYISKNRIYHTRTLNNGLIAIGTSTGGLLITDKEGHLIHKITETEGLQNNSIRFSYQDKFNNLWVATNNGLSYIILNSAINVFNKSKGISGVVFNTALHDNYLYAATSTGLYVKEDYGDFEKVKNTSGEVFMLQVVDNELYAANSYSMYHVKGKSAEIVLNNYTWNLREIKREGSKKYFAAGSSNGIYIYIKEGNKWSVFSKLNDFDIFSRYLEVDNNGNIWVGHTHKGIYKIVLAKNLKDCQVHQYNTENGLPSATDNRVFKIKIKGNDRIVFGTSNGIYKYDYQNDKFIQDELFIELLGDDEDINRFAQDKKGNINFRQGENLGVLVKGQDNKYTKTMAPFRKLKNIEIEHINTIEEGIAIFGAEENMFIYNPKNNYNPSQLYRTYINKVNFTDTLVNNPKLNSKSIPEFSFKKRSIIFEFSSGYFEEHNKNKFKYILEGYDEDWSEWKKEIKKEYTNLKEGTYNFKVVSKNIHDTESELAEYKFTISPPWYRTIVAYIAYSIILLTLIWLAVIANTFRLKRAKAKLEQEVRQRTAELRESNMFLEEQHAEMQQQQEEIVAHKEILEKQNKEILIQKDEILKQGEEIALKNEELEKLSIVASETDNSVIITDKNGEFEWANSGFNKLYEQSLNDYKRKFGSNIFSTSTNPHKKYIKERVLEQKKSAVYESSINKTNGEIIYLQTTLTPILNGNREIKKLIAIDTNINKLKHAENAIKKQNREHEKQNITIQKSLDYAQIIQQHMLPQIEQMDEHFRSFILSKPKRIVSGDFYWYKHFPEENIFYVALVDCTGHGVPGAFMSIMGMKLIDNIITQNGVRDPKIIVEKLEEGIISTFKQRYTENLDGMDLILCKIKKDKNSYLLNYIGANRPLIYYSAKSKQLKVIKGLGKTVGGVFNFDEDIAFKEDNIELESGDTIYLASDGYTDQLNEAQIKFGSKRFIGMLNKIAHKDISTQQSVLEREYEVHKNTTAQYDDITVWGIQLK